MSGDNGRRRVNMAFKLIEFVQTRAHMGSSLIKRPKTAIDVLHVQRGQSTHGHVPNKYISMITYV